MSNPQLEYLPDKDRWRLTAPLCTLEQTVPAGFETDGATVPRIWWPLFPRVGKYLKAAINMYVHAIASRPQADRLFLLNMKRDGVRVPRRYIMFIAVRLFGRGNYD